MSRPLRAVSRRLLEVSAAVAIVAGVESVHRRTAHRGPGRALNQCAQGVVSSLLILEWRTRRRSGAIPTKGRRAGRTCSGVCGKSVERRQRSDPCKGWRRSLATLSEPDTFTAPLVGFVG